MKRRTKIGIGAAVVIGGIIGIGAAAGSSSPAVPSRSPSPAPVVTTPAAPATTAPAPAQFTAAQQQALDSAEGYLQSGMGFSKAGLMGQLTSSSGEGFSRHLAAFAIKVLHPNWNRQAVLSAKGYLQSGMGFSYASLVQQLESSSGEGFTHAQAVHGARAAFRG